MHKLTDSLVSLIYWVYLTDHLFIKQLTDMTTKIIQFETISRFDINMMLLSNPSFRNHVPLMYPNDTYCTGLLRI
jgi:hypothetical protein